MIGIALDSWMLHPDWIRGESRPELVKLERMVDHIDRVCELAGNARHVAIGTDLDGGFGREQSPCDLDTIADLQNVPGLLARAATRKRTSKVSCTVTGYASSKKPGRRRSDLMGMDRKVTLRPDTVPSWERVREFCAARNYPVKMMMIDGELSFPDEQPPETWHELRVGTPQGMVTLRREADAIRLVTWGNASGPLLSAWNGLSWVLAEVFRGEVSDANGTQSAAQFAGEHELPAELR